MNHIWGISLRLLWRKLAHPGPLKNGHRLLMMLFILALLAARAPAATPGDGDLNSDGMLTPADRNMLRDYLAGKISLTAGQKTHADANADARVDVADLVNITNRLNAPTLTLNLAGGVQMVLARCPAGSFTMGSPNNERNRNSDEGPAHTVKISESFYLGKYEVTQAQWKAVMGSNPSQFQASHGYAENLARPVEQVSWNDIAGANGFLARLNTYLAGTGQGGAVRLPTEAEWEYACRAGTATRFYFGDSLAADDTGSDGATGSAAYPGNRSDFMWFGFNAENPHGTKPAGGKKKNAFGLYDLSGNVWEWCQDWYGPYASGTVTDPTGPASGTYRVFRGGGWYDSAANCRAACRLYYTPDYRYLTIGFRLARTN